MDFRKLGLAAATMLASTVMFGPVTATAQDDYFCNYEGCWPIVFAYTYYADPEKTEVLGYASDSCVGDGYVTNPYLPTNYYDRTPQYACSSLGPYLPNGWPY